MDGFHCFPFRANKQVVSYFETEPDCHPDVYDIYIYIHISCSVAASRKAHQDDTPFWEVRSLSANTFDMCLRVEAVAEQPSDIHCLEHI